MSAPILMTEEYWADSQLSVVRYFGRITVFNKSYIIVDKLGRDIFECSLIAEKEGRDKAIKPGEPCDLIDQQYVPVYRKLGRDKFLEWLKDDNQDHTLEAAKKFAGLKSTTKQKAGKKTKAKE